MPAYKLGESSWGREKKDEKEELFFYIKKCKTKQDDSRKKKCDTKEVSKKA